MQPTYIQTLLKGLQGIDVYLLLHQKALRVRLLAAYDFQPTLHRQPSSLSRAHSRIAQTIIASQDLYGNHQTRKGTDVTTKQRGAKHHLITPDGIAELQQHLQNLKQTRMAAVKELRELTSQSSAGSALEDSMRALYQDRALNIDSQIVYIEYILSTAKVLHKPTSKTQAQLGSQVTIELNGKRRVYTIVGSIEADPERGKVSNESPLGQSLLGKKVNDYFVLGRRGVGATVIAIE